MKTAVGALASFRQLERVPAFHPNTPKPKRAVLLLAAPLRVKFLGLREVDGRAPAEQPLDAEYDANPLGDAARGQVRRSES